MHSNPGAPLTLYLDFDGGTVFSTYRGPYDRDGNPLDYNATEITQITNCWKDITAMFSMFDVDVTTELPDVYHQTTAWLIVSPDMSGGASNTNMLPNLIARSANNQNNATSRTTGITHEYGHNIGLNHQKTFDASGNVIANYRPALNNVGAIMGVDYAGAFAQWWLGHGVAADGLQDDIQVIVSKLLAHAPPGYTGDGFADDDYAGDLNDPTANATYLTGTTSWSARGVIERMTDTDVFSFDWSGGHITVGASNRYSAAYSHYMSSVGLDVRVFSSSGGLVGFNGATTDDDTSYSVTMNLPAGRYYAAFSSFGNYADLGSYDVSIVSASKTNLATPKTTTAGMNALMAVDASSNLTSQVKLRLDNPDPSSQSVIVERSSDGVKWSSIYTSSTYAASRTITDSTVSAATKYFYRYGIRNSSGTWNYSSPLEVTTYNSAVSGLTITTLAASSKQVLDWADNYRDSGYAIKESVNGGAYVQIATTGTNFNMFVRAQTAGNTYAYQVTGLKGNSVPSAVADSGSTSRNRSVALSFSSLLGNDSDPDGDTVTLIDASDAPHGTVTINSSTRQITYTPDSGYYGSDWFNYRIADGKGNYSIATVNLTITPNLPGDADRNGTVDAADYITLKNNFGVAGAAWENGDFDGNGTVDQEDLRLLMANFGVSDSQAVAQSPAAQTGAQTSPATTLAPADALAAEAAAMDAATDSYGLPATPLTTSLGPDRTRACFDVLSAMVIRSEFRRPAALAPAAMPILGISGAEPWYSPPQVDLLALPDLRTLPARSLGRLLTNPLA
jgi:hypothetical protein